ncbi:MAG: ThuA domain-containing protein [Armatimonadetes bacterium]|nr:ThuA domain-containing protein [Armatimonadota bacterium]
MATDPIRVLVWDENSSQVPKSVYPENIRGAVAAGLRAFGGDLFNVQTACLDDPDQGVPLAMMEKIDVLVWWGHDRHAEVKDALAAAIAERVHKKGLGLVALHSAHYAKPFKKTLGCTGHLKGGWREDGQPEMIRVCAPWHPVARGIKDFTLAHEEMYGAPFDVPPPQCVVFQSYFPAGGEYFPSGLAWSVGTGIDPSFESGPGGGVSQGRGVGRVFYFRPGHETLPTFLNADVARIIANAVRWCAWRSEDEAGSSPR